MMKKIEFKQKHIKDKVIGFTLHRILCYDTLPTWHIGLFSYH